MQLKSLLITLSSCLLTAATASAQSSWHVGFGVNAGPATGEAFKYTLGGDIRAEKMFSNRVTGTLSAGFTHFFEKDHFRSYSQYGSPYNVIPVKAGVKYFAGRQFYLAGELGAGFAFEQWGTSFLWSPSVGFAFNNGLDLSLRYEDFTKSPATKAVSLRLGYNVDARKLAFHAKNDATTGWQLEMGLLYGQTLTGIQGGVLGAEVSLNKHLARNLEALVTTGYSHYFTQSYSYYWGDIKSLGGSINYASNGITIRKAAQNIIPLRAGIRAYAGNRLYAGAEAGAAIGINGPTSVVLAPSLGLNFNHINVSARYDYFKSDYQPDVLSLRLGYKFNL
ncbi:hypothetical protein [Mucilaginibacter sp. CSA2-8R]|uniref:hypothetical protein n=1 Tax=Mucilaginibacter sp. CSA2-8R TaxID=3141542 RepID=UPI00315D2632